MTILGTPDTVLLFFLIFGGRGYGGMRFSLLTYFCLRSACWQVQFCDLRSQREGERRGITVISGEFLQAHGWTHGLVYIQCVLVLYQPKHGCHHESYVNTFGNEWRFAWQEGPPYQSIGPCLCRGNQGLELQKNRAQRFKVLRWSSGCPELVKLIKLVKLVKHWLNWLNWLKHKEGFMLVIASKHIASVQHLRAQNPTWMSRETRRRALSSDHFICNTLQY